VLGLNNSTTQSLRGGAVVRRAWANTSRSTASAPVIEIPNTERRTVIYLNVYVCLAQPTCASGEGELRLRAKVSIIDPSANPQAGRREMTVLSWSLQG
jgi:hypothetical protein